MLYLPLRPSNTQTKAKASSLGLISLCLSCYTATTSANATQEHIANSASETVVITGSRTEKPLSESPVKIEVVTSQEIKLKNARDLKEAIKDVPGILLRKIHGKSGYEAWMQGVDAKRVLVLIDGEPTSRSTNGGTDLTQIGVMNIEQIEIVKGATSALYGSGAIGGVINVITSTPTSPFSYTLKVDAGSHGKQNPGGEQSDISTRSSAGAFQAHNEHWDGQLSYDFRDSDGFTVKQDDWEEEGAEGHRLNLNGELGYSPNGSTRFFVSGGYYDEELDTRYTGVGPAFIDGTKNEQVSRETYRTGANWLLEEQGELKLNYYYEKFENPTVQATSTGTVTLDRDPFHYTQKFSSQWDYQVNDNVIRTMGFEVFKERLSQSKWDPVNGYDAELKNAKRTEKVFYFQDDILIGERLSFLPGVRFQHDSDFGRYLAPKINGRIELDAIGNNDSFIRFGVGRGYGVPTLKERYYVFDHSINGYQVIGNPDLTPEYSDSLQLGWVVSQEALYSLDINFFRNDLEDFIETEFARMENIPGFGNVQIFEYGNVSKARTKGVELASVVHFSEEFKVNAGYTFLSSKNYDNGKSLSQRPKHQVKTSVTYQPINGPLSFNVSSRWQSKEYFDAENTQESKSYSVFDFSTNYQITDMLSLYGGIDNIGNTQKDFDSPHDLRPEEGRYVYLGVRLEQL